MIEDLSPYLIGWRGYFGFGQTPRVLTNLESWIRRRLRLYLWRQWRNGHNPLQSFVASASRRSPRRSLPVHRRVSGACPDTRRFNTPCEITYSTLLVFPESMCLWQLNSTELSWYGPVCPLVWEGWRRKTSPIPIFGTNRTNRAGLIMSVVQGRPSKASNRRFDPED